MTSSNRSEYVTLAVEDGTTMRTWLERPEGGKPHAGLMIFQEAFGVNAHIRDVAGRFAGEGYMSIVPELFHRTAPGFEGDYADFRSVMPHIQALTTEGLEADVRAAFEYLRKSSGTDALASVGYCMGGRVSFLANLAAPLKAAISYYGGGIAPGDRGPGLLNRVRDLHAPMLFFWGLKDEHIGIQQPRDVADAVRAAGKPFVSVEFSGAGHAFFNDARPSYNAEAAAESWGLTLEFLRIHLGKRPLM
ncbi:MAG: dienelactone hydrolase family protein [Terriglobia bacterium]